MIKIDAQDVRKAGIPGIESEIVHSFDWGCEDTCNPEVPVMFLFLNTAAHVDTVRLQTGFHKMQKIIINYLKRSLIQKQLITLIEKLLQPHTSVAVIWLLKQFRKAEAKGQQ